LLSKWSKGISFSWSTTHTNPRRIAAQGSQNRPKNLPGLRALVSNALRYVALDEIIINIVMDDLRDRASERSKRGFSGIACIETFMVPFSRQK
jgi:hypothetical protein